jgi:hypothetical protein
MILIKDMTLEMISLCRWLSIAATTLSIRIMLLPVLVYQMKATARLTVSVFFPHHVSVLELCFFSRFHLPPMWEGWRVNVCIDHLVSPFTSKHARKLGMTGYCFWSLQIGYCMQLLRPELERITNSIKESVSLGDSLLCH